MMAVRFLGVAFAYLIIFVISSFMKIPIMDMLTMCSFILIVDNLMVRFIARQYLMSVTHELTTLDKKDKEDDNG